MIHDVNIYDDVMQKQLRQMIEDNVGKAERVEHGKSNRNI